MRPRGRWRPHGADVVGRAGRGRGRVRPVRARPPRRTRSWSSPRSQAGATGRPATRRTSTNAARAHIAELVAAGRTAMVQSYQPAVDTEGEVGLVFLGGAFSHAIHKDPMIRRGVGASDSLIANQVVTGATPTGGQLAVARRAVAAAERLLGPTTYAAGRRGAGHGRRARRARARAPRPHALLRHASRESGALRRRPARACDAFLKGGMDEPDPPWAPSCVHRAPGGAQLASDEIHRAPSTRTPVTATTRTTVEDSRHAETL